MGRKVEGLGGKEDQPERLQDVLHGIHKLPLRILLLVPHLALHAIHPVKRGNRIHQNHLGIWNRGEQVRQRVHRRQKLQAVLAVQNVEPAETLCQQRLDLLVCRGLQQKAKVMKGEGKGNGARWGDVSPQDGLRWH